MKHIKQYIKFLPLTLLSMYLGMSFVHMTFDPNKWGGLSRSFGLFISVFVAGIITIIASMEDEA